MRRALALTVALAGCGGDEAPDPTPPVAAEAWTWALPVGFPTPVVPADNPMSAAKVELGRFLFYDERLSGNGSQSCAGCHEQARAFSDGRATPLGSTGAAHPRNAPGLANVAYNTTLTWANPGLDTLERQIVVPMFGDAPIELGIAGHEDEVLDRLRADPGYVERFAAAFPEDADPISFDRVVDALACFLRSMVAGGSPYDRLVAGDSSALSLSAKRGMALFFSEALECHHCHGGFNFTQSTVHAGQSVAERPFHNTGLYDIDGEGGYPLDNTGLYEITRRPEDMGRFRAPTLRNVALTAPYMHDGSVATLEEVVDIYAAGGRLIEDGPHAGDGRANRFKSGFVSGFSISDGEKADLIAFLWSLTDEGFVSDPRFADPFE
ncbi:MAG: di-heme enzyme [Myxococcales bacterium]|nr:di-heme enzyme [Myxococcales bacterium]MCB9541530.1 di-heme enzyme [Myxococcales bacterium]